MKLPRLDSAKIKFWHLYIHTEMLAVDAMEAVSEICELNQEEIYQLSSDITMEIMKNRTMNHVN